MSCTIYCIECTETDECNLVASFDSSSGRFDKTVECFLSLNLRLLQFFATSSVFVMRLLLK